MTIEELLKVRPQLGPLLERFGLGCAHCPQRNKDSLAFAAKLHEVSLPTLIAEISALAVAESVDYGPAFDIF